MSNPIKCDFCDSKADAREGDKPVYFCASCWLKKFPKNLCMVNTRRKRNENIQSI